MDNEVSEFVGRVKRVRKVVLCQDDDGVEVAQWRADIAMIGDADYEKAERSLDGCRILYDRTVEPPGTKPVVGQRVIAVQKPQHEVWDPEPVWKIRVPASPARRESRS